MAPKKKAPKKQINASKIAPFTCLHTCRCPQPGLFGAAGFKHLTNHHAKHNGASGYNFHTIKTIKDFEEIATVRKDEEGIPISTMDWSIDLDQAHALGYRSCLECNKEVVISSTNRAQEIIVIRRGYMQRLDTTIESFLRRESKNSILQHLNPTGQELGQEDSKLVDQLVGSAPLSPDLLYPDVPATKQAIDELVDDPSSFQMAIQRGDECIRVALSVVVAVELRDRLFGTILVALFFFLPSILRTLFSMFACVLIDQAAEAHYIPAAIGSFWVYDMNQQCFAGYHRAWAFGLGLPLALLVCLGIPFGMLLLLFVNKSRLKETTFIHHYSFLYKSYMEHFFYWESIIVCQTIILVAISVFGVNLGTYYQVVVMNAALIIIVVLLLVCRPYLYPQAGKVMLQAMLCLLLTSYVALTFLDYGDVPASPVYRLVMGCVLLVVNLTFIASVVWQMGKLV